MLELHTVLCKHDYLLTSVIRWKVRADESRLGVRRCELTAAVGCVGTLFSHNSTPCATTADRADSELSSVKLTFEVSW